MLLISFGSFIFGFSMLTNVSKAYAVEPIGFFVKPSSGYVAVGSEFVIDIMINSPSENLVTARAVLGFDPDVVKVTKAERNSAIFCLWPDDQQSVDNTNGLVMVTGFCQSGNGTPYKTVDGADVFARLTFKVLSAGSVNMKWEYSGQDEPFKSVLIKDGSPPINILDSAPVDPNFSAVKKTTTNTNNNNNNGVIPQTGLIDTSSAVVGGSILVGSLMLFVGGGILANISRRNTLKKYSTVVVYGKQEE